MTPPMATTKGRRRSPPRRRQRCSPTDQTIGAAAARHSTPTATMAIDIVNMANEVDAVLGGDHCHPMVSWAHMARANTTKVDSAPPTATRLRFGASSGSSG